MLCWNAPESNEHRDNNNHEDSVKEPDEHNMNSLRNVSLLKPNLRDSVKFTHTPTKIPQMS